MYSDYEDRDDLIDGVGFADPGGNSALRAATKNNPRIYSCPTCKAKNRLTRIDKQRGYQCDSCANRAERGGY
jgi:DNA-directed RNA polymerase subunit RPC12/RpoP